MLVEMVKDLVLEVSTGWYLIPGSCIQDLQHSNHYINLHVTFLEMVVPQSCP